MGLSDSIDLFPSDLQFSVFSGDEIKRMSVVRIITGLTFDALGQALPGGLYDQLMGPGGLKSYMNCTVCGGFGNCPGHIGHIELTALVFNPFFTKMVQKILSMNCLECFKFQIKEHVRVLTELQLRLCDAGYIVEAQELEMYKSEDAFHGEEEFVKQENGDFMHPRLAALEALLEEDNSNLCNNTKSSCATRTAIVNSTLQKHPSSKCMHCSKPLKNVRYLYRKIVYFLTAAEVRAKTGDAEKTTGNFKVIFADECRKYLRKIYENYPELLELLFPLLKTAKAIRPQIATNSPVDIFFIDTVIVTPPKARPIMMSRGKLQEHPSTNIYRNILENDAVLRVIMKRIKGQEDYQNEEAKETYEKAKGDSQYEKLYNAWQELQTSVDLLLDSSVTRDSVAAHGLKQILEKKDGLLRKHMMGKRVNYAARTVITPDPNINVEEVGIPDVFARKLTYPVPVTPWNVAELRKMVLNGPDVHPGANFIETGAGRTTSIPSNDATRRDAMAKALMTYGEQGVKYVHRHVVNGDVLLLNRQPSLHRASIMAHKVRILPGEKTFRLHYSNCKAYNADFDGDEMNAHFPQNEVARSEAYNLVNVANNYLVPKDGTPLGGLIQDHVISGVKLSIRGRFFNREDYHQLVYQGLAGKVGNIKFLPPAMLKPMTLWSGKQVLSTIIMNLIPGEGQKINLNSQAQIQSKHWQTQKKGVSPDEYTQLCEHIVNITGGELLVGVLDKKQYGATTFGLIHCVYELYGGDVSTRLLTAFTKVFTFFLQREGFTLGVKDILVTAEADNKRHKIIKKCRQIGPEIVANALELDEIPPLDVLEEKIKEAYQKDPKFRVILDRKYKGKLDEFTNSINRVCLPNGLITRFPENNLQLMILSGAKGSLVNSMQISCLLGQIELEGKRPPLMISGKSLPSFPVFETSPKSGGFIDGRFMTGIQPQDFFFHCMAGREGLIDTAVKTSRSGYLQRCLIKHLEGLTINYDLTVRDSDNSVIQFLYGEDGLDISKAKFLHSDVGRKVLLRNSNAILKAKEVDAIKDDESLSKIKKHNKKIQSWRKNAATSDNKKKFESAFTHFSVELRNEVDTKKPMEINSKTGRRRLDQGLIKLWKKADATSKELYEKQHTRCPDPVTSLYKPDRFYGAVPETIEKINSLYKNTKYKKNISDIMYIKAMKALASPGEPVGLLAAQSVGEPSTQMTLNTFHFAGRGEMNVTLGIPRLREILMLATSNIKTPSMDIPILANKTRKANQLRIKLNRVTLADVLQHVDVSIKLVLNPTRANQYKLRFQFLPREAYQDDYCLKPKQILRYVNQAFFKQLFRYLIKQSNVKNKVIEMSEDKEKSNENSDDDDDDGRVKPTNKKSNDNDKDSSDEDDGNDDNDATGIKLKSRKQDETEYDDPDDNEEIMDANVDDDDDVQIVDNADTPVKEIDDDENDKFVDDVMRNSMVHDYKYDTEQHLWCKITFNLDIRYKTPDISTIIKELAEKSVIHQVPNIKRSIIYKGENDIELLKTDGINIIEMFKHDDILDLNRLYANDIHAIAKTYGIEAAASVLIKEVTNVFKVYGINIDRRHLSLIADYMTFDGSFQPLSRRGMEYSASPLQQMTFESSLQFLKNAVQSGRNDELNSPSSRLVVGLPIRSGTGAFDLINKL